LNCIENYPRDLNLKQWKIIKHLIPAASRRGRKQIDRRRVINAILYRARTGCPWRYLPKSFPNRNAVYGVFRDWRIGGVWKRIPDKIREPVRKQAGKKPNLTAAMTASQSTHSAEGGDSLGI